MDRSSIEKTTFYDTKSGGSTSSLGPQVTLSPIAYQEATAGSSALLSKQPAVVPPSMASLDSRRSLLLKWIPVLYKGGATPYFVQRHVDVLCRLLNLSVQTTYIPGRVLLTWNESSTLKSEHTDSILYQPVAITVRVSWGFRVEMLQVVNNMLFDLEKHIDSPRHSIEELHAFIDKATASLPVYNNWVVLLAFGILSGSMAPAFFDGNYWDGLCAFVFGTIAGAFAIGSDYFPASFLFMHEAVCSFVCSLLSVLACAAFPKANLHYWPIVLATTIWILPGFSMVIGFMDVVAKFPVTGFIMHFCAVFVGLTMALGYASSIIFLKNVCNLTIPSLLPGGEPLSDPMRYLLSGIFSAACCVIFQASPRQIPLIVFSVLVCFAMIGSMGNPEPAVYGILAFFLGLVVRSCAKMLSQLPEASLYVAMLPLVPGSKIVRSTFALLTHLHGQEKLIADNAKYFPQWIESTFVCVVVAIGFIGSDVFFNKVIMRYLVTPALGPYFFYPLKRAILANSFVQSTGAFLANVERVLLRRSLDQVPPYISLHAVPQAVTSVSIVQGEELKRAEYPFVTASTTQSIV